MKGKQPLSRERGKRSSKSNVLVMWPHQILTRPRNSPFLQRLAANQRAKHLSLNDSPATTAGNARKIPVDRLDAHDVGTIASRLDAEKRTAELAAKERHASARNAIERSARERRDEHPWASGRAIEGQQLVRAGPARCALSRTNGCPHRRPTVIRAVRRSGSLLRDDTQHPPASNKKRRINGGVELRMRVGKILERHKVRAVEKQLTDSAAR